MNLQIQELSWHQTSISVVAAIRGRLGGLIGGRRRPGRHLATGERLEEHDWEMFQRCIIAAKVEARRRGTPVHWREICFELDAIQELVEAQQLTRDCCANHGSVARWFEYHKARVEPFLEAALARVPDQRAIFLPRLEEARTVCKLGATPNELLMYMVGARWYKSEDCQAQKDVGKRTASRHQIPAGWVRQMLDVVILEEKKNT